MHNAGSLFCLSFFFPFFFFYVFFVFPSVEGKKKNEEEKKKKRRPNIKIELPRKDNKWRRQEFSFSLLFTTGSLFRIQKHQLIGGGNETYFTRVYNQSFAL
jgi:hypothetical protein